MKKGRSNPARTPDKDFGLPKTGILRGRTNFKRLFEGPATVYSGSHLNLRFRRLPDAESECRVGFVVPRRLGKAHRRNYIKRILREAYRLNRHPLTETLKAASAGFHGVWIAKTTAMDFHTAEQEVIRLLDQVVQDLHATF